MATKRSASFKNSYSQLDNFSSIVLYDSVSKKKKGKIYDVERLISRKKVKYDTLYLIKWAGWPLQASSWEPSSNLSCDLLRGYQKPPKPSICRLDQAAKAFYCSILSMLKSKSVATGQVEIDHDVWRYITQGKGKPSEHKGYSLYDKEDFSRLTMLPDDWWYYCNEHGEGRKIYFPLKAKATLSWTPKKYIFHGAKVVRGPRIPVEKISVSFARAPCNVENVFR